MKVWHASPQWIESLSLSFAKIGEGSSMEGYGIYTSIYKETALNFLDDYRGKKGFLYSFDIDENVVLDGNKTSEGDYLKVLKSIEDITDQKIPYIENTFNNSHWLNYNKNNVFDLLSTYVPDQIVQNQVLKNAGFQAIKRYENICIIDDDILPASLTLEETRGDVVAPIENGQKTSTRIDKPQRYYSENLEIASYEIQRIPNITLQNNFNRIVHLLLADQYIHNNNSSEAQDAYTLRSLIGNYIYKNDYSSERLQVILDTVDNTLLKDNDKTNIKENLVSLSSQLNDYNNLKNNIKNIDAQTMKSYFYNVNTFDNIIDKICQKGNENEKICSVMALQEIVSFCNKKDFNKISEAWESVLGGGDTNSLLSVKNGYILSNLIKETKNLNQKTLNKSLNKELAL